jgi:formate dehydrogenase iron-sulfur subunit
MHRRTFLKNLSVLGGSSLSIATSRAEERAVGNRPVGVLVDTTRCLGCRSCEMACSKAHGLPKPDFDPKTGYNKPRTMTERQWTAVSRYQTDAGRIFVKRQCMHCSQPACAAACPTKAMYKTSGGPVIWREDKCMGCRYCMISCPFDVPKFEFGSAVPRIQKCIMCWDRLEKGEKPACVQNCVGKALVFGSRSEMMELAKERIYGNPDKYHHHVYGENEVGGTGWFYISAVPFEQIGFRDDLGTTAYPEYTREFLYSVPVVLLLWPAMLLALNKATDKEDNSQA